jgi:hypothetical protein
VTPRDSYRNRLIAVLIVSDRRENVASITVRASIGGGDSAPLALVEGATTDFHGALIRVARVVKSEIDPALYGNWALSRWLISISYKGGLPNNTRVSAFDKDGSLIEAVNGDGKPVKVASHLLSQLPEIQLSSNVVPPLQRATIVVTGLGYSWRRELGDQTIVSNIDPQFIKEVRISASAGRMVTITDIPMEPGR